MQLPSLPASLLFTSACCLLPCTQPAAIVSASGVGVWERIIPALAGQCLILLDLMAPIGVSEKDRPCISLRICNCVACPQRLSAEVLLPSFVSRWWQIYMDDDCRGVLRGICCRCLGPAFSGLENQSNLPVFLLSSHCPTRHPGNFFVFLVISGMLYISREEETE